MAAFDEINSTPAQDKFSVFYAIFNATMAFFKGQTAGKVLTANGAGAPVWSYPEIRFAVANIGDWDMDASVSVDVTLPLSLTRESIRTVSVMVRNDAQTDSYFPLDIIQGGEIQGGIDFETAESFPDTTIRLTRLSAGYFDSTSFNLTSYNRGFVTIGYVE